ncbi:MAG: hypothetical protein RML72_00055 [Bacteroidia bacterium]|nr:hypothetical protein [Bacteroidia bacterium]MDW8157261.1 hypothetical protein [Bacteroidia bacterium]
MLTTPQDWLIFIQKPQFLSYTYENQFFSTEKLALYLQKHHTAWPRQVIIAQIKNIQKAHKKLPSWVDAQCIFPTQAYEQATSERAAAFKTNYTGKILLDIGLGLGVDSWNFSSAFEEVWSVEKDPVLCKIAHHNLHRLLGRPNIKIIETSIEQILQSRLPRNIDTIYIDPSRRNEIKPKLTAINYLEPNLLKLLPILRPQTQTIILKLSPLFDIQEGLRVFHPYVNKVQVIAIDNECKEVVFELNTTGIYSSPIIEACIDRNKDIQVINCNLEKLKELDFPFAQEGCFLYEADVGIYKAGLEALLTEKFKEQGALGWTSKGGYLLSNEMLQNFPGKGYAIEGPFLYKKYQARRLLHQKKINYATLSKKNIEISIQQLYRELEVKPKEGITLFFTQNKRKESIFFIGERVSRN